MLFLREAEVKALLTMEGTIAALEAALKEWAAGRASNQPRRRVAAGTVLATMSAALPSKGLVGFKAYTANREGARFWLALFSASDGRPKAVIEADWLGRMRTGAAAALATRHLARSDAAILTILGSGTQALTQVLAIAAVRSLREVRVFSRTPSNRAQFVERLRAEIGGGMNIREAAEARDAVDGADIISTITSASRPILFGSWLTAGQHLNVSGSNIPGHREVDGEAVERVELLVADDADAARVEAGDLLLAEGEGRLQWSRVHSLREVVAGKLGRGQPSDITLFKSVGLALEDVATGAALLELAEARGVGKTLPDLEKDQDWH